MYEHVPSESLLEIDRGFCTHSTRWFDRRHSWAIDFLKSHYKELVQVVLLPFFPPNFLERIGLFRPLEWFQMRAKIHKFFDLGSGYSSSAWGLLTKGITPSLSTLHSIHISLNVKKYKLRDFRKALGPTVAARRLQRRRPVQSDDNIENGRMIATIQASKPGNDYYSIWVPMRTARGHLQSSARWICSMFCSGNPHWWFSRISQSKNNCLLCVSNIQWYSLWSDSLLQHVFFDVLSENVRIYCIKINHDLRVSDLYCHVYSKPALKGHLKNEM